MTVRGTTRLIGLIVSVLSLNACAAPQQTSATAAAAPPAKPMQLSGVLSCTAHVDGKLPAVTWKQIPFRQENERLSGLYTFTDSYRHQDSVVFSGTVAGQASRVTATAVRADGSPNFTVDLAGTPTSLTGPMMQGMSQRPVRSCALALKRA